MRLIAAVAAAFFVVGSAPALADTPAPGPPTHAEHQAQPGGAPMSPAPPVRRRRCETVQAMGSNMGRRVCAMYTDEEWAARRRMNQEQQRQNTDVCNRGGAMESC